MLIPTRLPASIGVKTSAAISKAGTFIVLDPWTIAKAASVPAPRCRKALATGTMQAEHRFMAGPTSKPPREPRTPCRDHVPYRMPGGSRNVSVSPAIRKAKTIPSEISFR